uniref:F-box domain-containing protein n=1 Tax=Fagus sylvatica TaxID=28930 RepID=A0A2N9F4C0_FAGSY
MSSLPEEVILEILSRLPVKPLLRFRCVSKPWLARIDSQEFIKLHLKQSLKTNTNRSLLLIDCYLYSSDFDSLDRAIELDHPLKTPQIGTEILGSCNGLLCLYNSGEDAVLWNPSTRKYKKLPVSMMEVPHDVRVCRSVTYGFGYDEKSDDYKGSRLSLLFVINPCSFGTLASGALHWLVNPKVKSDRTNLILAFDLAVEEYRLVPQPDFYDKNSSMDVGVLGGCLTILCHRYRHRLDVWVMKEYGVKDSWMKLFSVTQPETIRSFDYVRPVAYSKSGGEVLLGKDVKKLVWYDLNKKRVRNVRIQGAPDMFDLDICWGSLVSLGGNGEGNAECKEATSRREEEKQEE